MAPQKIHCPICHGTGKVLDSKHGQIACLNCIGSGIVELNYEQQIIIDKITENQRQARIEHERKEQESLRIQREKEKQQEIVERKEKESNNTVLGIVLIIAAVVISIIVIYWHEIINFLWEVIKGIFYLVIGFGIVAGLLSWASNSE